MSRRTAVIVAALLVLIGARMPAWREAAAADTAQAQAQGGNGPAQDGGDVRAAWQIAPVLRRRLGIVLVQLGS
jgi:hypothetical protein